MRVDQVAWELDEQFVLRHSEDRREVRHLCPVSVGEEAGDPHLHLSSLDHPDLNIKQEIRAGAPST